jgi:precorrin-6B methylase 1
VSGRGSLVCVGVGMTLGSHITPLARSHIEKSDVVFTALSDALMELWLARMSADVRSLQRHYREGKSRLRTYREMVAALIAEVRAGKRVCAAFYGHPGVFAWPAHEAIELARREGYPAHMEPGISAADCLYADLGIDPGRVGCQHFEATQFMLYRRRVDTAAYLVLWQIGVAGDRSLARFATGAAQRRVLVEVLARDFDPAHEVILYEAATLAVSRPRMLRLPLGALPEAECDMHSTLVIPPASALAPDEGIRERLRMLDSPAVDNARGRPPTPTDRSTARRSRSCAM